MAKETKKINFKNAYISIEENTIYEYEKESILTHNLMDVLASYLPDEHSRVDISINTSSEVLGEDE